MVLTDRWCGLSQRLCDRVTDDGEIGVLVRIDKDSYVGQIAQRLGVNYGDTKDVTAS